jgi:hypothetical protein
MRSAVRPAASHDTPRAVSRACSLVVVFALVGLGCGGPQKPALKPDDPGETEPKTSEADADGGSSDTASASTDNAPPAPISCIAESVCSEQTLGGKEAAEAKDRCKGASGEPHDAACSKDELLATCVIESKSLSLYYYKDKSEKVSKGRLRAGQTTCKNLGGSFTKTGSGGGAKTGGGGGAHKGGGKKPKPKKK